MAKGSECDHPSHHLPMIKQSLQKGKKTRLWRTSEVVMKVGCGSGMLKVDPVAER